MNKLVSRNPVQRFKQGKKIEKFQGGGRKSSNEKWAEFWGNIFDNWNWRTGILGSNTPPKDYVPLGGVQTIRQKYLGKSNMSVAKEETHNYLEGLRNKYVRPFNKKNNFSTKTTIPVNNYYLKGFENRKDEISKLGGVRAMQQKLWDLGLLKGSKFGIDGKWGKDTEAAYQKYLNLKNIPTINQPTNVVSPAEQMGIYTEENKPLYQKIGLVLKQGGSLLPSKNIVERFKIRKGQLGLISALLPKKNKNIKKSKDDFGNDVVTTTIENRGRNPFKTREIISQEVTYNKENPEYNDTVYTYFPQQYISLNPKYETSNNWKTAGVSLRRPQFERLRNIFNNLNGTPKFKKFQVGGPVTTLKTGGEIPKLQNGQYIIKKGDTLSAIAKKNNMSLQELLKLNQNIKNANKIDIGQKININQESSPVPNYLLRGNNKINIPTVQSTTQENFVAGKHYKTSNTKKSIQSSPSNKQKTKKEQTLKERYWSLTPAQRSTWVGEDMNTYANTPEYRAEFDRYQPTKTEMGSTVYRSRLGDLGLVSNNDGTYSLYDKNGKLIDKCAQTTNALQEMLQKHQNTIGDAWTSHGMYGDSMLVNGYKYLPKIGGYNKITHTLQNLAAATAVQSKLNGLDLQTGDVVGLYSANSDYNDKAWKEGTRNRSNSHEGLVFRPGKNKNQTYIIHNVNGKISVDPISKFMVSESGLTLDWAPTYVMRPNSGPSVQEQSEQPLTYNASKNGKDYYDFLTLAGKRKYGIDIHSGKDYILMNGKPKEI